MKTPASCVRAVIAVACLAVSWAAASAQTTRNVTEGGSPQGNLRIAQWTTAQGLPQNTVTSIVFLPNGEMWLGTFGGLARFDGRQFHVLDVAGDEGLPSHRIVSLAAAGTDALWFLTQQGHLGRIERGRAVPRVPPADPGEDALGLLVSRSGKLFCRLRDSTLWHTDGTRPWQSFPRGSIPRGWSLALAETADGTAWALWEGRLVNIAGDPPSPTVALPEREMVACRRQGGGLWLGGGRGVARFTDGRIERLDVRPPIEHRVTALESSNDDTVWVGSPDDVSRLDRQPNGTWSRTPLPLGLTGGTGIRSLALDAEGSLWIGTGGRGLFRVNRTPIRRHGDPLKMGGASSLASDGLGGAFVMGGCRELFHVDRGGTTTAVHLPFQSDRGDTVGCGIALARASGDTVWARVDSGLFLVRRQQLEARRVPADVVFDEGPVASNPDGTVWVGSRSGTVQLVSPGGRVTRTVQLAAPLMSASTAPDGSLWVGGDGEVFRVAANAVERYGRDAQVPRGLVRDILAEADGTAWIGAYGGGLGRLRAGRVARLTVEHGLPDNSVSRILDDGRGRLWISTNRGVAVAEKRDLHAAADGALRRLMPVVIGPERGVSEANFGSPAGFAEPDGRLWFTTIDGVVSIEASAFPFNTTPPKVRIEGLWADDRLLPLEDAVPIPRATARIRLGFGASELLYPELQRFRYRIDGVDAGWVDAGAQRFLAWSPSAPGRYRVSVEARNEDGVWSAAPAAIVLDVPPAWWETTGVRAAGVVALVLAVAAAYRLRVRRIERRHAGELRALEERRQAEERVADLRAQLEHVSRAALAGELAASLAHEVRQPIGSMVNNAESGRRHLAQYLQRPADLEAIFDDIVADGLRASEVVRGLRSFLRRSEAEAADVDLSSLVREMLPLVRRELQDHGVTVELALEERLPPAQGSRVQLGQIVVNLIMNACEALVEQPGERRVTVATRTRGDRVELGVEDNGPGLSASVASRLFEPFVTTKPEGLGMGLAICRSIAESHGGRLSAETPLTGGFRMVLSLPAAGAHAERS
jgi:signal transduction histidine kinase/ligand-binding sensor domain-containing protein